MTLVYILAHPVIIRRKRRGIIPLAIKQCKYSNNEDWKMIGKKYAGIACNEQFMEINTGSFSGWVTDDPLGEDIYLEPQSSAR